jgi:hypothetical protein
MMIQKATAMKIAIASIMLTGIIETSNYTLANAQSDSATMKEQEIDQKNVCSGWAQCTNNAEDTIDSSDEVDTQALIAMPH